MPNPVVHFEIPATDPDRLQKFYSDLFGWKFKGSGMPGMDYRLINTGQGQRFGGGLYKKTEEQQGRVNYVLVPAIDAAIANFQQAAGTVVVGKQEVPGMGWAAIGLDPERNPVGLWQPMRRAPTKRRAKARRKTRR